MNTEDITEFIRQLTEAKRNGATTANMDDVIILAGWVLELAIELNTHRHGYRWEKAIKGVR